MPDAGTRTRSLSLRKIVLLNTGQDVNRCMGCQFCDAIPSHELDIPLTSMIQLVNLNDEEVLTSKTLWSAEVLAHAREACSRQLNLEAIILALRSEAVLRGLVPKEIIKKD
ncbi:MAG TPA: hypothetical protein VLM83_07150 [Anaerolineales bacterium]|nr:hypothetical protein [Anaerolineales bacterium]